MDLSAVPGDAASLLLATLAELTAPYYPQNKLRKGLGSSDRQGIDSEILNVEWLWPGAPDATV